MSHEFEVGFSTREPAWHGLAIVLPEYPGREEAMRIAGHNFTIAERPVFILDGQDQVMVDGYKALLRDDTNAAMGIVKDTYEVVQNDTLWDIVDALVSEPNVKYETAGILKGGAVLWVLARLNEPIKIKGDRSYIFPYCLVSTTHDGTGACRASATAVRVICWNTYSKAAADSARDGFQFTFRHTKKVMDRIDQAKAALGMVRHEFEEFQMLAEELATIEMSDSQVKNWLAAFIPEPPADIITDRVRSNIDNARQDVWGILDSETIPAEHRRTAYGVWSAGIEYLDHVRGARNPETYFKRSMLDVDATKQRLVNQIREAVKT